MKERWVKIKGFENYEISDGGRIKSVERILGGRSGSSRLKKESILTPQVNTWGFAYVSLYDGTGGRKNLHVHTMVARHFLGPSPFRKHSVLHANKVKTDNRMVNLSYAPVGTGCRHARGKAPRRVLRIDGNDNRKEYKSLRSAARDTGCGPSHIAGVCNNQRGFKKAAGYYWEFV